MNNKNNELGDQHAPTKMSRKSFLRLSVGVAAAAGLGSLTGCSNNGRALRFDSRAFGAEIGEIRRKDGRGDLDRTVECHGIGPVHVTHAPHIRAAPVLG